MVEGKRFYWFDGQAVQGPLTGVALRELALQGQIGPQTDIRLGETGRRHEARKLKGLFDAEGQALPHPPGTFPEKAATGRAVPPPVPVTPADEVAAELLAKPAPAPMLQLETAPVVPNPSPRKRRVAPEPRTAARMMPPGSWLQPLAGLLQGGFAAPSRAQLWPIASAAYAGVIVSFVPYAILAVVQVSGVPNDKAVAVLTTLLWAVALLGTLVVGHYVLQQMVAANERILVAECAISTRAPYECLGMLSLLAGVIGGLGSIWLAIVSEALMPLMLGVPGGLAGWVLAMHLFHIERLGLVEREGTKPAEDALAFGAMLLKTPILILPSLLIVAGVGAVLVNLTGALVSLTVLVQPEAVVGEWGPLFLLLLGAPPGVTQVLVVLGLLPIAAFCWAVVTSVMIDLARSILEIARNTRPA